jgi:hypothetical protein
MGTQMRSVLYGLCLISAVWAVPAAAQELDIPQVRYPSLPAEAARAEGFVPAGWSIERRAQGDLNADGLADLALVLRARDRRNILANNDGFGENPFDTNPRILVVAFARPGGAGYRLAVRNHSLIARRTNPGQLDPFGEEDSIFEIARGTLRLSLHLFMTAGGWTMGNSIFTLRWQGDALRLIGFDSTTVQRNSGDTESLSVNYLTRRVRAGTGHMGRDTERVRWRRLRPGPLLTVAQIGDGLEFDPERRR